MGWLHNLHAQSPERQHPSVAAASLAYTSATFLFFSSFFFFPVPSCCRDHRWFRLLPRSPRLARERWRIGSRFVLAVANQEQCESRRRMKGCQTGGHAWWDAHALPPY
ncbi:hypothetical protein M441DRAFT_317797 [Trichoderma asperellum CBS 433.97]|uniref:Uncharacterized protein n=1 Tax=Trichoderma asperellum (strain ATCC 204424 / CBS 433.97 / NBRC 101777) TaxID=1042311 RepID=A0A2T3ZKX8_TRIA4|nr:hypothetical protein M441DRAFT_317797 [Trichoderma asperellum CBS 433.97]PTB45460.1 hypothetical protein M441DRAFT_317797 [Trichoderma asperellum CBS 433.97]